MDNQGNAFFFVCQVVDKTKSLLSANPDLPYLVYRLDACAQNKALDGALKQVSTMNSKDPSCKGDAHFS